jgi:hypothetical protein
VTSSQTPANTQDFFEPGRASFDWSLLFSALAIVVPVSGLVAMMLSQRARQRSSARWKVAMAMAVWCTALGVGARLVLHVGVIP